MFKNELPQPKEASLLYAPFQPLRMKKLMKIEIKVTSGWKLCCHNIPNTLT